MSERPVKIAVMALGGQGGGVLSAWLVRAGERAGFIAQSTSVPGVAQRTGATIYYVELFPEAIAAKAGRQPVLALMPAPGDVDILIASELMEAGRALQRGLLSANTTLIASTHRVYAIAEKIAPGDGRGDAVAVRNAASRASGRSVFLDMEQLAAEAGSQISAVLLGALAGSGASPIPREAFEAAIREGGRAVETNLRGFARGFSAASEAAPPAADPGPARTQGAAAPRVGRLVARLESLPPAARDAALEGLKRVVDFQDIWYGDLYLDRLDKMAAIDAMAGGARHGHALAKSVAGKLALAMSYEDVVRVADLKTRSSRRARVLRDVRAGSGQIVRVYEFMHPRLEEFCDLLPSPVASALLKWKAVRQCFDLAFGNGRRVETTGLSGFLMLSLVASLRFMRRSSSRFANEQARIERWLDFIHEAAGRDYALAVEIARLQRLIKGYGDTHARGLARYETILAALDRVRSDPAPAASLRRLRDSALQDEEGAALARELSRLAAGGMSATR